MEIELKQRYPVLVGDPERYEIVLVGCGGTGSFLALHLARLAYHAREQYGREVALTFVDPDRVEAANLGRQNFAPAEVGAYKSWTLATRYGTAFGLRITAHTERFAGMHLPRGPFVLLVGAVDNAAARRSLHQTLVQQRRGLWWLDCGNHEHAGQVLLGNRHDLAAPALSPLGFCEGLPLPSVQHPELLEGAAAPSGGASCADLTLRDVQGLMVNQAVATYAAQYVYRLVVTHDLDVYATYVDLQSGSARSLGITDRRFQRGRHIRSLQVLETKRACSS